MDRRESAEPGLATTCARYAPRDSSTRAAVGRWFCMTPRLRAALAGVRARSRASNPSSEHDRQRAAGARGGRIGADFGVACGREESAPALSALACLNGAEGAIPTRLASLRACASPDRSLAASRRPATRAPCARAASDPATQPTLPARGRVRAGRRATRMPCPPLAAVLCPAGRWRPPVASPRRGTTPRDREDARRLAEGGDPAGRALEPAVRARGRFLTTHAIPERARWAVETLAVQPDDRVLEIGGGPGVAASLVCECLDRGRLLLIDRSPIGTERRSTASRPPGTSTMPVAGSPFVRAPDGNLIGLTEESG